MGFRCDHPIKRNENVFGFALSCAGLELNQFISMVVAPGGVADYGAQNYHLVSGTIDRDERDCRPSCPFTHGLVGHGDRAGFDATGEHRAAAITRAARETRQRRRSIKVALALERLLERGRLRL